MQHHAYFLTGDIDAGIKAARAFGETLGLSGHDNPDVIVLQAALFSVDEARRLSEVVSRMPSAGSRKLIVAAAPRIFHEAQNALLKTFEEPPEGTYLVLIVPAEGTLIPTLRSRLLPLPVAKVVPESSSAFWNGTPAAREKVVAAILDHAKSDKPEEKQAARSEALAFVEGLVHEAYPKKEEPAVRAFLQDLDKFIPILHERAAPLKMILEHILVVAPKR